MLGAASHLLAVKRRWIDWSGRVAEEERYWFIIWPVGVVRSGGKCQWVGLSWTAGGVVGGAAGRIDGELDSQPLEKDNRGALLT